MDTEGNPIADASVYVLTIMRSRVGRTGEKVATGPKGVAEICETTPMGSSFEACAAGYSCRSTFNYEGDRFQGPIVGAHSVAWPA